MKLALFTDVDQHVPRALVCDSTGRLHRSVRPRDAPGVEHPRHHHRARQLQDRLPPKPRRRAPASRLRRHQPRRARAPGHRGQGRATPRRRRQVRARGAPGRGSARPGASAAAITARAGRVAVCLDPGEEDGEGRGGVGGAQSGHGFGRLRGVGVYADAEADVERDPLDWSCYL